MDMRSLLLDLLNMHLLQLLLRGLRWGLCQQALALQHRG